MPSVENGVIKQLSASSINSFDTSTAFGCERRWWYKYVQGLSEPQKGNQELGETLHKLIEQRLKTGADPAVEHEAVGLYLAGKHVIDDVAARKVLGVELPLAGFSIDGIRTVGFVDVVTENGIIDWKTTSDIRRYGKTAEDLATDTQMLVYAKAIHSDLERVKIAHGQFQTRGAKRAEFVEVEVTREHIDTHFEKVIVPLVRRMKEAATVEDVNNLPRNDKACFSCAFTSHCPTAEGNQIMSFFKKFSSPTTSSTPAPATEPAPVLPADAPKSDPALAAKPVEGFQAVPPAKEHRMVIKDMEPTPTPVIEAAPAPVEVAEQPKRGRGRPPGSKNKPKLANAPLVSVEPPAPVAVELKDAGEVAVRAPASVTVKSVTVSKGFTVNLGAFNNVRFDVSVTGEGSDLETVYSTLMGEVEERLAAEAAKYEAEVDQKNKTMKPAGEVVCK